MNPLYVSYDIAVILKDFGFDEPCLKYKDPHQVIFEDEWDDWNSKENYVSIPFYQQVFNWFEKVHKLSGSVSIGPSGKYVSDVWVWLGDAKGWDRILGVQYYPTKQDAQNATILKMIELKTKQ